MQGVEDAGYVEEEGEEQVEVEGACCSGAGIDSEGRDEEGTHDL